MDFLQTSGLKFGFSTSSTDEKLIEGNQKRNYENRDFRRIFFQFQNFFLDEFIYEVGLLAG